MIIINHAYSLKNIEFNEIIINKGIESYYQPIVSLEDASILGYEALTRGPVGSEFRSPLFLFDYAQKYGNVYTLERIAREKAIEGCESLQRKQKIFINISAQIINDPEFTPGETYKLLEQFNLNPDNIVFEITERSSIENFSTAKKILKHYRNQGYQIAIDDAGAGYSSLQAIAELQPNFIKVDQSLIKGIHREKVKEYILETFVTFAQKMNIQIIAEGIEEKDELVKLKRMGIHFGQGFLLGRPVPQLSNLSMDVECEIKKMEKIDLTYGSTLQIGDLCSSIKTIEKSTHISEVSDFFKSNENSLGLVILSNQIPVGLLMKEKLYQMLAEQYGLPLYWNRSVEKIMDKNPLIVDENMAIEQVAKMAMSRENNKLYDFVIVTTKENSLVGITSIQSILEYTSNARLEHARIANPLTGLPGNIQIQRELHQRIKSKQFFSVIYADLDYFKWYNDCFGFQKGDELIQFTVSVIHQAITTFGHADDFIGHIGGDDFIVLTSSVDPEVICAEMIRRFDEGVQDFYEGQVCFVEDRKGNTIDTDGVTLSLSLLICKGFLQQITVDRISRASTKLKKKAKEHRGSIYKMAIIDDLEI